MEIVILKASLLTIFNTGCFDRLKRVENMLAKDSVDFLTATDGGEILYMGMKFPDGASGDRERMYGTSNRP
jgi:hypothetical protein